MIMKNFAAIDFETGKTGELKLYAQGTAGYNYGLCSIFAKSYLV